MTALMSAGWSGMTFIEDIDRGVMDRLLVSPVWRGSLNIGVLVQGAFITLVQSAVRVGVAGRVGARVGGGAGGVGALVGVAMLRGGALSPLSHGVRPGAPL